MMNFSEKIFRNLDGEEFNGLAIELFHRTMACNPLYREFCEALRTAPRDVTHFKSIPFLPVSFFKTRKVYSSDTEPEKVFLSSGTTGMERSSHHVASLDLYRKSLTEGFRHFYGNPSDYVIGALTPTQEENPGSSLIFMISELMSHTSGTFLGLDPSDSDPLCPLRPLWLKKKKVLLIGLTYALLDLVEKGVDKDSSLIIVETGGMKGRRKEMIREELHEKLKAGFGVEKIHSEYGMSELLSQAWSQGDGLYRCPPWMKVLIRDVNDPLSPVPPGQTGGINIIDLANIYSCPFIATQDLGIVHDDDSFEVLGRFDYSDVRGCSLMV
jgi:hypothetical protein